MLYQSLYLAYGDYSAISFLEISTQTVSSIFKHVCLTSRMNDIPGRHHLVYTVLYAFVDIYTAKNTAKVSCSFPAYLHHLRFRLLPD